MADINFDFLVRQLALAQQRRLMLEKAYAGQISDVTTAKKAEKELESNLRETAMKHFMETGDFSPHDALDIKNVTRKVYNTDVNLAKALAFNPALITANMDRINAAMPEIADILFIMSDEEQSDKWAKCGERLSDLIIHCLVVDEKAMKDAVERGAAPWAEEREEKVVTVYLKSRLGEYAMDEDLPF